MKNNVQTAWKAIVMVIILTLINCLLLVLSFCLPTAPMRAHVAESYPLIEMEHQYLHWDEGYTSSMLDFWSEYTLYGAAINEDAPGNAFEKAMMMWYIDTQGLDRDKGVLQYARYPEKYFELTAYPRYWNGSVILFKLLLLIFNIPDIRMLNMFLNFSLLVVTVCLMAKRGMEKELIPFMTAVFFINPITMIYSIIFSAEYIPMLVASIVILLFGEKIDKIKGGWNLLFAFVGAMVSFYAFFSTPFIALGIPLVVLVWYLKEKNVVKTVLSNTFYWGVGYVITWAMKWIICSVFTSYNLIEDVINRVDVYENVDNVQNSGTTLADRFMQNLWVYKNAAFMILFFVAIVLIVVVFYARYRSASVKGMNMEVVTEKKNMVDVILGYIIVVLIPFAITLVLGNGYAYNHAFMTHRNFAISAIGGLCIVQSLLELYEQKKRG